MFVVNKQGYIFEINNKVGFSVERLIEKGCFLSEDSKKADDKVMEILDLTPEEVAIPYYIDYKKSHDICATDIRMYCDRGYGSDIEGDLEDFVAEYVE